MIRLVIVVICYALVIFTLPGWAPYAELEDQLSRLPAKTAFMINIAALLSAGGLLHGLLRQPGGLLHRKPSDALLILRTGLLGVVFATLFDLAEGSSGYAMTVSHILILPIAFLAGEAAYVFALRAWRSFTPQGRKQYEAYKAAMEEAREAPEAFGEGMADESEDASGVPRLVVTIPVYVLILVFLPRQQDFQTLTSGLENISPTLGLGISVAALILAAILFLWTRHTADKTAKAERDAPLVNARSLDIRQAKFNIYATISISLGIGAAINLVGYFIGYAPSMRLMLIMTSCFTIAELVYVLINIRVKHGPMGM